MSVVGWKPRQRMKPWPRKELPAFLRTCRQEPGSRIHRVVVVGYGAESSMTTRKFNEQEKLRPSQKSWACPRYSGTRQECFLDSKHLHRAWVNVTMEHIVSPKNAIFYMKYMPRRLRECALAPLDPSPPADAPAAEEGDWRVPKSGESPATATDVATATATAADGDDQSSPFRSPPQSHAKSDASGGSSSSSRGNKSEWQCSACTFANPASKRKCIMCTMGSRPPGMGRSQPLSPRPAGDTNREQEARSSPASGAQKKVRCGAVRCGDVMRRLGFWLCGVCLTTVGVGGWLRSRLPFDCLCLSMILVDLVLAVL